MRRLGSRSIRVNKNELIEQIKANKDKHIAQFNDAVKAYQNEALRQLTEQTIRVKSGALDAQLDLTTPVNNEENYDKIIEMFEWEVESTVELSQSEFIEYVQDESDFAIMALHSNTKYMR